MATQYGVLPIRSHRNEVQVMLITSRDTGRWVVPRGNPIGGLSPAESAAQEAFEEAGIRGALGPAPLGSYQYDKRGRNGAITRTEVQLFRMTVAEELDDWPERGQRQRRWFSPLEAAQAVDEAELKALIVAAETSFS